MSRHLFWYGGLCSFTNIKVATISVDIMSTHGKAIANLYEDLLITASPLMPSRRQKRRKLFIDRAPTSRFYE
eukprot:scaffold118135_cov46-Cyclotella_meneghiniana.AAC.1